MPVSLGNSTKIVLTTIPSTEPCKYFVYKSKYSPVEERSRFLIFRASYFPSKFKFDKAWYLKVDTSPTECCDIVGTHKVKYDLGVKSLTRKAFCSLSEGERGTPEKIYKLEL